MNDTRKREIRDVIGLLRQIEKDLHMTMTTEDQLMQIDYVEIAVTRMIRAKTKTETLALEIGREAGRVKLNG